MYTETFLDQFKDASQRSGFKLSIYGKIDGMELPVLERIHGEVSPTIYISAGVHGDEPAPPMAASGLSNRAVPAWPSKPATRLCPSVFTALAK